MESTQDRPTRPAKFPGVRPKAVSLPKGDLVTMKPLLEGKSFPLLVEPAAPDLDIEEWGRSHRDLLEKKLLEQVALLFRNMGIPSVQAFERFAESVTPDLADDNGELPRSNISGRIYSVSYAPPDQPILWHSENSFCPRWPMKLWFFCGLPPKEGGETPIVDNREVLRRLKPAVGENFREKGIVYLRNCGRGLDFTWQTAFQTDDREEVERRCREGGIEFEWKDNDIFHTRTVRPAIFRHPRTGEEVFFAQPMLWHVGTYQAKAALQSFFRPEDLPRHCAYGDGTPMADETARHIYDVYRECEVAFPWQKGDAILIDNMLLAHARNSFVGPRKIYAVVAEQISDQDLESARTIQ